MSLRGRHILLLEDDPLVAAHLTATLKKQGADVTNLSTVRELKAFDPQNTELAIVDFSLRDGEAIGNLDALVAAQVALIFHTGSDDITAIQKAHPGSSILPKPSRDTDLISMCVKMIEERA